jgi:hypothetical protein
LLVLNWRELTISNDKGKTVYKNAWATTHRIHGDHVAEMAAAGRARWKIENENNNVLKNHGYHFEHNFGHGKQHVSNTNDQPWPEIVIIAPIRKQATDGFCLWHYPL